MIPSTFSPSSIFVTIIVLSIIKLSAESTSSSSIRQSSLDMGSKQINSTNSPSPVSEEERLQYLAELQATTTTAMIPTIVFILLLAIIGFIGNSLVIIVYSLKFKESATKVLIISIAVFDLLTNVLSIPGDISDMLNLWNFDNPPLCRAKILFMTFPMISSAFALLAVAVVRYRKICTPHHWQVTTGMAKLISTGSTILGVIISIPSAAIFGRQTMVTSRPDIVGYACLVDDTYFSTVWPLLNYGLFLALYVGGCVPLTVLYILIGKQAWKHRTRRESPSPAAMRTRTQTESSSSNDINQSKQSQSDGIHCMKQLDSSESTAISTFSNEDILNKQLEHTDQGTVQLFNDRVENRTQMREVVAYLLKITSGLDSVPGNRVATEDGQMTHTENVKGVDQEMNCDLLTGDQADEHPVHDSDWVTQNGVRYSDVRMGDIRACLNSTEIVIEKDEISHVGCKAEIRPTRVCPSYTNQTHRARYPFSFSAELTTDTTFIANSKKASDPNINVDFGFTSTSCTDTLEEAAIGTHSLTSDNHLSLSLASDPSQTCDLDPVAVRKWLDIVSSQDEVQTTANIDTPTTGNSFTFRISPSNNLLQQVDCLRDRIAGGLTMSLSERSEEITEVNKDENVEIEIVENRNKSTDEREHEDIPFVKVTQSNSRLTTKTRLKELIARKFPILVIRSKKTSKERRPKPPIFNRTTVMLFIISAIYILGYLPHLGLMFFEFSAPEEFEAMTMTGYTVYNLFVRTIFVNSAVNPIIYSLCDRNFRKESIGLFSHFSAKLRI